MEVVGSLSFKSSGRSSSGAVLNSTELGVDSGPLVAGAPDANDISVDQSEIFLRVVFRFSRIVHIPL